jgi:hypothetical protein
MVSVASRHFTVTEFTDITALVYRWCLLVVNDGEGLGVAKATRPQTENSGKQIEAGQA